MQQDTNTPTDGQEPVENFQRKPEVVDSDAADVDDLVENGPPALFEGINDKLPKSLLKLAEAVKKKRDEMISAKNDYVGDRDMLIDKMQQLKLQEFALATGETVKLTDTVGVKIAKPKKKNLDMSELDEVD